MPTLNITKREATELFQNLQSVGNLSGPRFVYVIAKNISILKDEIKALNEAQKPTDEFMEFDKERVELAKQFAAKDKDGKPRTFMDGNQSKFVIEDIDAFEKAAKKLKKEHKEAVEAREKQMEDFNKIMEEEIDIHLYGLNQEDLPEDITARQLSGIFLLMNEEEVEEAK